MSDDPSTESVFDWFDRALTIAPGAREAWLATSLPDESCRRQVRALLSAHESTGGILDREVGEVVADVLDTDRDLDTHLGPYEVVREVGRGGMGRVYEGRDPRLGRAVAIKVLADDLSTEPDVVRRFLDEARTASSLDHPGIATVYDVGVTPDGRDFIVMAFYAGPSLRERLAGGPMDESTVVRVVTEVADALDAAHRAGIVHRDVKPGNIMFTDRDEARIVDFGVAKIVRGGERTQAGSRVGTLAYMSPEQVEAEAVDARTDVWALGVVAYEMLTGVSPFERDNDAATLRAILDDDPAPPDTRRDGISRAVARAVMLALEKSPDRRPFSAGAFARSLLSEPSSHTSLLPTHLTRFVGRDESLESLLAMLEVGRLVTVTGAAGTGKTRLAVEAARRAASGFETSVFVSLSAVREPDRLLGTIADELERARGTTPVTATAVRSTLEVLIDEIGSRRMLLVLDNLEQVVSGAPDLAALLAACPRLHLIVTSRVLLAIDGERAFPLEPLPVPREEDAPDPDRLRESPSVLLFVDRAQAARPHFELDASNAAAVVGIVRRLDGIPLAIELAAARLRLFTADALLERLGHRLSVLRGGSRDRPARHQTLRAAIEWSHRLLDADEQTVFRRLAVFPGSFTIDDADVVAGVDADPVDVLGALVDHSLIRTVDGPEPRFAMLGTMREFAHELLDESGETAGAERRLAGVVRALAERAAPELTGPSQGTWLDRIGLEMPNVRAAMAWASDAGEAETGLAIGAALWRYWVVRGSMHEGRKHLEALLRIPGAEAPTHARARVLNAIGTMAHNEGRNRFAREVLEEAAGIARDLEDEPTSALVLNNLAWVACELGELGDAARWAADGLALNARLDDRRGQAVAWNNLGWIANYRGRHGEAIDANERSLALRREVGDERGASFALGNLAWAHAMRGDRETARSLLTEAETTLRRLSDRTLLGWTRTLQAMVELDGGAPEHVEALIDEALALWRDGGNKSGEAWSFSLMARLRLRRGDPRAALEAIDRGLGYWGQIESRWGRALALSIRASTLVELGDVEAAHADAHEALEIASDVDAYTMPLCHEALAAVEAARDRDLEAARHLGVASALRREMALPRDAASESRLARLGDEVAGRLGADAFDDALRAGAESVARPDGA